MWVVRVGVVSLALAVVTSGCVPSRDNPFDPKNAPTSGLRIVDLTSPGADVSNLSTRCPALSGEELRAAVIDANPVSFSTRSRCLFLDATASGDPQGGSATLEFSYAYATTGGDAVVVAFLSTGADIVALNLPPYDASVIDVLPIGREVTFTVAIESDGARSQSSSPLVLSNQPPVADAGPVRLLPLNGFPWSGSTDIDVLFDGSRSTDPDGDLIREYCWLIERDGTGNFEDLGCTSNHTLTYPVDATEPSFIQAYLRVGDGATRSLASFTSVLVGQPVSWTGTSEEGLYRSMDGRRQFYSFSIDTQGAPTEAIGTLVEIPNDPIMLFRYDRFVNGQPMFRAGTYPNFGDKTSNPVTTLTENSVTFVPDPANARVWTLSDTSSGPRIRAWDIVHNPGSVDLVLVSGFPVMWPIAAGFPLHVRGFIDDDASLVIHSRGSPVLVRVDPADPANISLVPIGASRQVQNIGVRPDSSDEPWMLTVLDGDSTTPPDPGDDGSAHLVVNFGQPDEISYPTGHGAALGLSWIDRSQFWIMVDSLGLVRVDATELERGVSFDAAIVQIVPSITTPEAQELVSDPVTGDCVINAFSEPFSSEPVRYKRVRRAGGEVVEYPDSDGFRIFQYDRSGVAFFRIDEREIFRGLSVTIDGAIAVVPGNPLGNVSADPSTGGLWIPHGFPTFIERRAPDGGADLLFSTIDEGTEAARSVPLIFKFAASPDGSRLYALAIDLVDFEPFVERYDVTPDGLVSMPIFNSTTADELSQDLFEASAPVPSSTPFLWVYRTDLREVQARNGDGSPGGVSYALPVDEGFEVGANSSFDNHLCFATKVFDGMATNVMLRQMSAAGVVGPATVGTNASFFAPAVSAVRDVCWIAWTQTGAGADPDIRIRVITEDGSVLHSFDQNAFGVVTSIAPIDEHDAYITRRVGGETFVSVVSFSGTLNSGVLAAIEGDGSVIFQGPGIGVTSD